MSYINTWWVYLLLFAIGAIALIVGVYVYRDARARGMKAGSWTLIAILMPCFIGLILYVLLRDDDQKLRCAACDYPVKPDWKVCPMCETPLIEKRGIDSALPIRDKGIWKVTAAAVVIPVLICALMGTVMMSRMDSHNLGVACSYDMTKENVQSRELQKWFQECDAESGDGGCYVLWQSGGKEDSGKESAVSYVIYVKGGDRLRYVDSKTSFDQREIRLERQEGKNEKGYVMMGMAQYDGKLRLAISIDGTESTLENREADFDLEGVIEEELD